jgi:hypothetical protein
MKDYKQDKNKQNKQNNKQTPVNPISSRRLIASWVHALRRLQVPAITKLLEALDHPSALSRSEFVHARVVALSLQLISLPLALSQGYLT